MEFRCPGALGTYEWMVMSFGLKDPGATYQRVMNSIIHDYIKTFMKVYINDKVIKSVSRQGHLDYHRQLFERMRKYVHLYVLFACRLEIFPIS